MGKEDSRGRAPARRPTSRDVAAAAGVSRATVSYVALPGDMALIGCDDSPAAERSRPRLTTMRFDDHGRWRDIASHLHAMISGEGQHPKVVASEPAVVAGQTT